MEILGVGPLEFLLILILALVIMGPQDMVGTARRLGQWIYRVVRSPTWRAILETSQDLRDLPQKIVRDAGIEEAIQEVKDTTEQVKSEMAETTREVNDEMQTAVREANVGMNEAAAVAGTALASAGAPGDAVVWPEQALANAEEPPVPAPTDEPDSAVLPEPAAPPKKRPGRKPKAVQPEAQPAETPVSAVLPEPAEPAAPPKKRPGRRPKAVQPAEPPSAPVASLSPEWNFTLGFPESSAPQVITPEMIASAPPPASEDLAPQGETPAGLPEPEAPSQNWAAGVAPGRFFSAPASQPPAVEEGGPPAPAGVETAAPLAAPPLVEASPEPVELPDQEAMPSPAASMPDWALGVPTGLDPQVGFEVLARGSMDEMLKRLDRLDAAVAAAPAEAPLEPAPVSRPPRRPRKAAAAVQPPAEPPLEPAPRRRRKPAAPPPPKPGDDFSI